jgi:hypothetical protein
VTVTTLAPIAGKLQRLIRLLASDRDGEVLAAARALIRTLESAKLDIHALADNIANDYSEADVLRARDLGIAEGRRLEQQEHGEAMFRNVNIDDEPSWNEIARECARHPHRMYGEHEKNFVDQMVRRTARGGEPKPKQADWLRKIYARVHR